MDTNSFDKLVRQKNKIVANNDFTIGVSGFDKQVKETNKNNIPSIIKRPPGFKSKIDTIIDPTINKPTFLSQGTPDTRKEDTVFTKLGRIVLPNFLEKSFGIDETQRKPKPMSESDRLAIIGNSQTIEMLRKNTELIGNVQYLKSGMGLGNDPTSLLPGYKNDISISDLPDPVTIGQKIAYAAGATLTMVAAQPLIESATIGLISKISGGAELLSKISTVSKLSPWTIGYPMAITKAGIEGGLFGLITKNKKTVARNVLETAGIFAGFTAILFPILQFFKPILNEVAKFKINNPRLNSILGDPSVTNPTVSETLWFRNPNDKTQILKITKEGILPGTTKDVVQSGVKVKDIPVLYKLDIEAFKEKPSLYNQLTSWLGGKKIEVPFTDTPKSVDATIVTKPNIKVANDLHNWTTGGSINRELPKDTIDFLKKNPIGVKELPVDNNGMVTLYRDGTIVQGRAQSYSLSRIDPKQVEFKIPINKILVNFNSNKIDNLYMSSFTTEEIKKGIMKQRNLNKFEKEVIVITPKPIETNIRPSLDKLKSMTKKELIAFSNKTGVYINKNANKLAILTQIMLKEDPISKKDNKPFDITPTIKDRTPFDITPSGTQAPGTSTEPFVPKENANKNIQLVSEDINAKIQQKANDLMQNTYNNDPKFKEQALKEAKDYVKNYIDVQGKSIERPRILVNKTQVKQMMSGLQEKYIEMNVIIRDDKRYLYFKNDNTNILLRPSALGLLEKNIYEGDTLKIDISKLKSKGVSLRGVDSKGKVLASKGSTNISNFEKRTNNPKESLIDDFKLFQHVNEMIQKYAERVGEKYLPRGTQGVYYHGTTKNIRLTNMNELSVASHEISHYLDERFNITPKLRAITSYTKVGNPIYDPKTYKERKEMSDLYIRYYPRGRNTHKLNTKMSEGFATLIQKYVEMPKTITESYPNLVNSFLKKGGKYYNEVIGEMISDLGKIVEDYQALSAIDKVGAVVTGDKNKVLKDSFLNFWQKIRTEIADNIYPIEVLSQKAGVWMTNNDPSLWLRMYNSSTTYVMNNIMGNKGFWMYKDGEVKKVSDSNWKTLLDRLKKEKTHDSFNIYLISRDEYFQYQKLDKLKIQADASVALFKEAQAKITKESTPKEIGSLNILKLNSEESKKIYENLKSVLNKNQLSKENVTNSYKENKDRFIEEEKLYDELGLHDVEFAHNKDIGLLSDEQYKLYKEREGYAPRKHEFYDDIIGDEQLNNKKSSGTKVSSFKSRKGSGRTILFPIEESIKAHSEVIRKGLKQLVYNKIAVNISEKFPALFQKQQLQVIPDKNTGTIAFPQEKDPNIIMAIINGKKVPILTDSYVKNILDDIMSFNDVHILTKILVSTSRIFTKGTTAAYPQFLINNLAMDTISSTAQTQTKMIPLTSAMRTMIEAIFDKTSIEANFLKEYMILVGARQTLVGYQNMSANELSDALTKERKGILNFLDAVNKGAEILSIPSQYSEIMTRSTEYIRSRKQGDSQVVAIEKAGRVTAPFHHIGRLWGSGGRTAVKTIPFFNPMLQVLDQTIQTAETPEGRQRIAFVMSVLLTIMVGGTAATIIGGSKKQKRMLADLNPQEISMFLYYPSLDGDELGKIRLPENYSWFGSLVNMMVIDKELNANYTAGEYFSGGTSFLPNQLKPWDVNNFVWSYIPQFAKTGLLVSANRKDFPNIMDLQSQSQLSKEPGLRYTDSSSKLAIWLGKEFNLSPIKTDALMTGLLGRASGFATLKPSALRISSQFFRKEYFNSGRTMQLYFDIKISNEQKMKSIKEKLRPFTPEERNKQLRLNRIISVIDKRIKLYRKVDEKVNPKRAEELKQSIYKLIKDNLTK